MKILQRNLKRNYEATVRRVKRLEAKKLSERKLNKVVKRNTKVEVSSGDR